MTHAIHFFCPGKPPSAIRERYDEALSAFDDARIIWHTPSGLSAVFTQHVRDWGPNPIEHLRSFAPDATTLSLVAFSAGYGAVRELLRDPAHRDHIDAVVLLDALHAGTAADGTSHDSQIVPFARYATRAKSHANDALLWVAHTDVRTHGYESTTETAEELVDTAGGEGGQFMVHSYDLEPASQAKAEHAGALVNWGPGYVGEALVPHLAGLKTRRTTLNIGDSSPPAGLLETPRSVAAWFDPLLPISERAVLWSLAQLSLGGIETAGRNAGPIIASYHRGAKRRDASGVERPVGIRSGDWCASALCFGERRCLLEGERPVLPWRVSGMEMQRDAAELGLWRPVGDVRLGHWRPAVGDVALFIRPANADPRTEWRRHISRVSVAPDDAGAYQTIDANQGDRWARRDRKLSDGNLLGFIEYPRAELMSFDADTAAHFASVNEELRLGLDGAGLGLLMPQDLVG